jgi:hypothetical protein
MTAEPMKRGLSRFLLGDFSTLRPGEAVHGLIDAATP